MLAKLSHASYNTGTKLYFSTLKFIKHYKDVLRIQKKGGKDMPDMHDCPVCGSARDTRTLGGNCPRCFSKLIPEIMTNLPDKLKIFFEGPNPNPHPRAEELEMTWFNKPRELTYKQAEEIAINRVLYAKRINAEVNSDSKEALRKERDRKEDEIAERIYDVLMERWVKTAQEAKRNKEARGFLDSALRKE